MSEQTQQATRFDLMCVTDDLHKDVSEVRNQLDELRDEYEEYSRHESGNRDEVWERLNDQGHDIRNLENNLSDLDPSYAFDDIRHDVNLHDDRLDELEEKLRQQDVIIDALLDQLEARNR